MSQQDIYDSDMLLAKRRFERRPWSENPKQTRRWIFAFISARFAMACVDPLTCQPLVILCDLPILVSIATLLKDKILQTPLRIDHPFDGLIFPIAGIFMDLAPLAFRLSIVQNSLLGKVLMCIYTLWSFSHVVEFVECICLGVSGMTTYFLWLQGVISFVPTAYFVGDPSSKALVRVSSPADPVLQVFQDLAIVLLMFFASYGLHGIYDIIRQNPAVDKGKKTPPQAFETDEACSNEHIVPAYHADEQRLGTSIMRRELSAPQLTSSDCPRPHLGRQYSMPEWSTSGSPKPQLHRETSMPLPWGHSKPPLAPKPKKSRSPTFSLPLQPIEERVKMH